MRFSPPTLRRIVVGSFAVVSGLTNLSAQEPTTLSAERTYYLDDRGDARVEQSFQLGAKDWAKWKQQFGDHPDILLRNLKYQMAAAVVEDYALEKDDMNRRAVVKVKARALARYRGDGQFSVQVPKEMKLITGSGAEWVFTSTGVDSGTIMNLTDRAKLPSNARDARLVNGNDFNQLVYSVPHTPARPKMLLFAAIALLALGAVMGLTSFAIRTRTSLAVTVSDPPPRLPT